MNNFTKTTIFIGAFLWTSFASAQQVADSTGTLLDEVVITNNDPKNYLGYKEMPISYNTLSAGKLKDLGVNSIKDASQFVPNLFIPDYGAKLTSAMYIRGVGSRINTPSVGLYVDDMAFREKSAFDVSFADVQRVEILRGPQSTLYGKNAMGGILKIYTFDPWNTQKGGRVTSFNLGMSTKDVGRYINFRNANVIGEKAAYSFSAFYDGNDGYNRNDFLGIKSNGGNEGGAKLRFVYKPKVNTRIDFQTSLEHSEENGYDYYKVADLTDNTYSPGGFGLIRENVLGSYRRTLFNNNLKIIKDFKHFTLSSITGYQLLNDRMFMDQDFSPQNIFTLEQKQKSHSLSEEIVAKSNGKSRLKWVGGVYVAKQWLKTEAPVVFGKEGLDLLIQSGINKGFEAANAAMSPMGMSIAAVLNDDNMTVDGSFNTPTFNLAAFGEATFADLLPRLDITAGVRVDYEHNKVDYNSGAITNFTFKMMRGPMTMINKEYSAEARYNDVLSNNYTHCLPKVALTYRLDKDNSIYASVSKGFRSGGYNIQMFSDLIQYALRNEMTAVLQADPTIGPAMERNGVTAGDNPDAKNTIVYKPETSWNYELGTHLSLLKGHLNINAAAFYLNVTDQQISKFAQTGLGRQMVNAGKSESYGAEISAQAWTRIWSNTLTFFASYGFTHATFKDYDNGDKVYDGNYVPFAPQHTLSAGAEYAFPIKNVNFTFGANLTGNGKTYWTEDNSVAEPFYLLLGAHFRAQYKKVAINLWAKNITDKKYVPFYFESMSQGFAQTSRPRQFGVDLTINL